MFIGHFAVGFASKKIAPKTSLAALLLAATFVDVLFPFFLLLGWEHVRIQPGATVVMPLDLYDYPISHSLIAGIGWALLLAGVYWGITRYSRGAWVLAAGVLSHWVLDFVSHRPDMPILPTAESPKFGLGLWNSLPATLAVEIPLFAAGIWIYARATRAKDAQGTWGLVSFVLFLSLGYLANLFGPPPPNVEAFGYMGFATLVLFAWPY